MGEGRCDGVFLKRICRCTGPCIDGTRVADCAHRETMICRRPPRCDTVPCAKNRRLSGAPTEQLQAAPFEIWEESDLGERKNALLFFDVT